MAVHDSRRWSKPTRVILEELVSASIHAAFLVLVGVLLAPSLAHAKGDARVSVSIDPEVVELGQMFEYTISAATDGSDNIRVLREPDFRPFSVLGRSQMPQFIVRNGVAQRSLTVVYKLRTRRLGEFEIPPPTLSVGKQQVAGEPLKIKVVKEGQAPKKQGPSRSGAAYVDVQLELDRNPYVGEQIALGYDLFINTNKLDGQPLPPTEPSLDAFWIENLSDQTTGTKQLVRIGSKFFEKIPLLKYALFPLRAGPTSIEPLKVEIVSGGFLSRQRRFEIVSDGIKLDVQPLPPGAPDRFYEGNVGDWDFLVTTDVRETRVGRAVTVKVIARGDGQPGRLQLPELPEVEGTRLAGSEETSNREIRGARIVGEKIHSYSLTPLVEGKMTIPSMTFSYFDPEAGEYRTKESAPVHIHVGQGTLPEVAEDLPEPAPRRSGSTEDDLLSSLRSEMSGPRRDLHFGHHRGLFSPKGLLYKILAAIPLLILFILGFGPRLRGFFRRDTPQRRRKEAARAVEALLAGDGESGSEGWDVVIEAIKGYATGVLGLSSGHVTERELARRAMERGVPEELARQLGDLLERGNKARFSPSKQRDAAALETLRDQTRETIATIEALRKKKRLDLDGAMNALLAALCVGVVILVVSLPGAVSASTVEDARALSVKALEAQDAREWEEAITLWEQVDALTPNESDVLYNLGTARMQAGQLASARHALERALLHDPRGRDVANNLDLVTRMIRVRTIESIRGRSGRVGVSDDLFWWDVARSVTGELLSIVLLVSLWTLLIVVLIRPRMRQPAIRDTLMILGVLAAILIVASSVGWFARDHVMQSNDPAVIMTGEPRLREGPSAHAAILQVAHPIAPGMRVPIEESRQGWAKVRLPDGSGGWIPIDALARIR